MKLRIVRVILFLKGDVNMFNITSDFPGGNIIVSSILNDTVYVKPDMRDTEGEWFYWAFRVEGAGGLTLKFVFNNYYVGYFGAAVSHDYSDWKWQHSYESKPSLSFTYTFAPDENTVYFAHSMLYRPERLFCFAEKNGLKISTLCKSEKGRDVPCIRMGNGKQNIILTSRHHACESTGSYVLEGVLERFSKKLPDNISVFCVPMVDFDGVTDGDQGKNRIPHDHNRDYGRNEDAIYSSVKAIRDYSDSNPPCLGFDFHSPYQFGDKNDTVFIVHNSCCYENSQLFSQMLQSNTENASFRHYVKDDMPPETDWNHDVTPDFNSYMRRHPECLIAVSVETCYFGKEDNFFTEKNAIELGRHIADTICEYLKDRG